MPKLLLFAPCERVAFGQQDNLACLIAILQGFEVSVISGALEKQTEESGAQSTPEISLPIRWTIFTMWRLDKAERGKIFEQACQLITPSGKISLDQVIEFGHDPKEFQRNTMQVFGFPAFEEGEYTLKLLIGERGKQRKEEATYPLTVSRKPDQNSSTDAS